MFLKSEGQYDDYVKKLGEATGIDIEEISCLSSVMQLSQSSIMMMNNSCTRGGLTNEKKEKIAYYNTKIQYYDAQNEPTLVLQYYDSLCAVCRTIDGFVFGTNEHGLDTISLNENSIVLNLPFEEMHGYVEYAEEIKEELQTKDNYNNLPDDVKQEIIEASLYVAINNGLTKEKMCQPTDCYQTARNWLAAKLAGATVLYIVAAAACAGTLVAVLACEAVAAAGYASACSDAITIYEYEINECNRLNNM